MRLGEQLIEAGLVTPEAMATAVALQRQSGGYLADVLLGHELIAEGPLLALLSQQLGGQYITCEELQQVRPSSAVLQALPLDEAERLCVMPLSLDGNGALRLAVPDADPAFLRRVYGTLTAAAMVPVMGARAAILAAINRYYRNDAYAFAAFARRPLATPALPASHQSAGLAAATRFAVPNLAAEPVLLPQATETSDPAALRRELEARDRRIKQLEVANELYGHLARERDVSVLLQRLTAFAFDTLDADDAVVLWSEPGEELTPRAARSRSAEPLTAIPAALVQEVVTSKQGVGSIDAVHDPRDANNGRAGDGGLRSIMCVPLVVFGDVRGVLLVCSRVMGNAFSPVDLPVLGGIAAQASTSIENAILNEQRRSDAATRSHLSRFFSPALVEIASSGGLDFGEAGELVDATILFADIRGFTPLAEQLAPREVMSLLSEHFETMVEVVFDHGGVLDKFIGDALMAIWGVPLRYPDEAERAFRAALDMQRFVQVMNKMRGRQRFEIGIGINTGPVVFGAVGGARRLELTTIGDAVNVASRMCGLAAPGKIVASHASVLAAGARFETRALAEVKLKGKSVATVPYELIKVIDA